MHSTHHFHPARIRFVMGLLVLALSLVAIPGLQPAVAQGPTVALSNNADSGAFLVGANGMTLYIFKKDQPDKSACFDKCAENWPILTVGDNEKPTAGEGIPGTLGVIKRADGKSQVTYNGQPLYYWVKDTAAGQTTGEGVGNVWYLARPQTITASKNDKLGRFLVGSNGMTLYLYTKDTAGVSNCYDKCAQNWPPLLVVEGETLTAGAGITGKLGTIKRTDGTLQVTYNDVPLYFWVKDQLPGDTTGQDVGNVWFVVKP
jgi:predicted lipoprotein with Yx(FWY)xxD motif